MNITDKLISATKYSIAVFVVSPVLTLLESSTSLSDVSSDPPVSVLFFFKLSKDLLNFSFASSI